MRDFDFANLPATKALLQQLPSGRVDAKAIVFGDLTGDKRDEAVVPVTSDGTLGNIAYLVFSSDNGTPKAILTRTMDRSTPSGLKMTIVDGTLVETAGVYGNEDPLCCPSQLRKTTFRWDGSRLQVASETTEKQPAGPKS